MKKQNPPRIKILLSAAVMFMSVLFPVLVPNQASAVNEQITDRSLRLTSDVDPGSEAGGTVGHNFAFTLNDTADDLGSITFQYCTTAAAVADGVDCNAPTGVDVSGASLDNESGETGFTTLTTSSVCDGGCGVTNTITIGRASAASRTGSTASTYEFSGVVNPTTVNETFFVRVTTHTTLDGSPDGDGQPNDTGTVAASTAEPIILSGDMPESLVFCTGEAISETDNVPDCSSATAGDVAFNKLFSPEDTAWATSQMAASTNAGSGYSITVHGPTMTSGGNSITAIGGTSTTSAPGTSQFGMNLVEDDEPNTANPGNPIVNPASADVTTPSGNSLHNGQAVAPYTTGGDSSTALFAYQTGDEVANSNSAGSDSQVFTATYMINVPGSQPAGTYTTTLTYICTPTF